MRDMHLEVVEVPTSDLVPYANNANVHTGQQIDQIAKSIDEFGFCDPVGVWTNPDGVIEIVEGHGRVLAAKRLGYDTLPVIYLDALSDEQRRAYTHVHNQLTRNSSFDIAILDDEIEALDFDWEALGFDSIMDEADAVEPTEEDISSPTLADRFGVPPFTVLNAREGKWQDRKKDWIGLGIRSEIGRGEGYVESDGSRRGISSGGGSSLMAYQSQDKLNAFMRSRAGRRSR